MRDVKVVKEKRNQLRNELATFVQVKEDRFPSPTRYTDLDAFNRQVFSYMMGYMNSLRNQINALEYVLNEDTDLNDYSRPLPAHVQSGISRELVLSMASEDTEINNRTFYS